MYECTINFNLLSKNKKSEVFQRPSLFLISIEIALFYRNCAFSFFFFFYSFANWALYRLA